MKEIELNKVLQSGRPLMVGVYWAGKCEKISMRDRENEGRRREAYVVRETVMSETEPVAVTAFLNDEDVRVSYKGDPVLNWKPSAKKGERVVVLVESMEKNLGAVTLRGKVEPLT